MQSVFLNTFGMEIRALTKDLYFYKDGTVSSDLDETKVLHREDGPACIEAGFAEAWFFDGVRHRDHGPAVIYKDGTTEWWVHGVRVPAKVPGRDAESRL